MKKHLLSVIAIFGFLSVIAATQSQATYLSGLQQTGVAVGIQWFFNQQSIPQANTQAQCSAFWGQEKYYLSGDLDVDGIPDMGRPWFFKDNFLYPSPATSRVALIVPRFNQYNGTTVSYYTPTGGANAINIYGSGTQYPLTSQIAFYRFSKVAPLNQPVRAVESEPLLIEAPQTRLTGDANMQLVFNVNFAPFSSWGNGTSDYFLATVASLTDFNQIPNSAKRRMKGGLTDPNGPVWPTDYLNQVNQNTARSINWGAESIHDAECLNVKTSRCGDGIVDSGSFNNGTANEQCDLGSVNGQPGITCSASCMPVIVVVEPDVSIVKTVVGNTTGYQSGDTITYNITYRNIGSGLATSVTIVDDLPANVTFVSSVSTPAIGNPTQAGTILTWPTIASLAPGAQGNITVTVRLGAVAACTALTNRAGITAQNESPSNSGNNNSSVDVTTRCLNPDVWTLKSNSAISGNYLPGQTVQYVLSYGNQGLAAASGVILTDTLPGQVTYVSSAGTPNIGAPVQSGQTLTWNVGTLSPNQTGQVIVRVTINATTPVCTNLQVNNNLTISATNEPLTVLGNNPSSSFFTMQCIDLRSRKVVDKPLVISGDVVTYTIAYGNSGAIALTGVVTDSMPTGMLFLPPSTSIPNVGQPAVAGGNPDTLVWQVGLLQPGFSGTITFQARVFQLTTGQVYTNGVCITGDNGINNNNCGSAVSTTTGSTPLPSFDLSVDKTPKFRTVLTGDIFDYTLTVRNTGNVAVTGFSVRDYLPSGLDYVSSSNAGAYLTGTRTVTRTGLAIAPIGSLALTVRVQYVGPGAQTNWTEICDYNSNSGAALPKDVDSNACNGTGNNEDDVSSGTVIPGSNFYDLSIDKLINGSKNLTITVGSTVTIGLTVANSGTVGVTGFSVNDYMPTGLNYVLGSSNMPNTSYDPVTRIITITGLNIGAVASFGITFQAVYSDAVLRTNYTEICTYDGTGSAVFPQDIDSIPCNRGPNTPIEDDESSAQIQPGGGGGGGQSIDLALDKLVNGVKDYTANLGEVVTFTIKVRNVGNQDFRDASVYDYIPVGVDYVAGSATPNTLPITVAYDSATRKLIWSGLNLNGGGGGFIDLSFQAKYNDNVVRTNYTEICNYPGMASPTNPRDTNSNPCNRGANAPIEDDESQALIRPRTGGGGGGRNYCGDGLIARPNSNGQYEECDLGTDQTQPDYNGKPGGKCSITCKDTIVNGSCGNYVVNVGEVCDRGPTGGLILTGIYKGKMCSSSCTIPGKIAPMCDYIDPPSIQQGEYLPYRWDLENLGGVVTSCTAAGQIVRDTMKCEFKLTDAHGNTLQVLPNEDCYQPLGSADVMLKSAYEQTMRSLGYTNPFMDKIKPYGFDAKQFTFTTLGEHKISLAVKKYSRCEAGLSGAFTQIPVAVPEAGFERVCEMNFAVTKPYMVSRGPLGNFASDPLTSFLALPNGTKIFPSAVPQITTKFDVTQDVRDSVNKLVDTYAGLAVSAGTLPGTTKTIKKVPGKDVYLVDAAGSYVTIGDNSENAVGDKPFTLIVTNGDLVVKGNLAKASRGMYIVKNGNIKFSMEDCNITQAVQGIFITLASVESLNAEGRASIHNTDASKVRCNGGDLTIKGVVIGNGVKPMAESNLRRSNVNTWFTDTNNSIQANRQEYLLNHGALVLKYNSDLFDNLPPGADILSQVLSTYKK